jgi:hypothetical protein
MSDQTYNILGLANTAGQALSSSAGARLGFVNVSPGTAPAGTCAIYDDTAANAPNLIITIQLTVAMSYEFGAIMKRGIFIVVTGLANTSAAISYA